METNFPGLIPDDALSNGLIPIEYVGAKRHAIDNVARSGKCWNGKGDVQEVTPGQARILMAYPDQWRRAHGVIASILPEQLPVPGADGTQEPKTISEDDLHRKPLEKMTKAELKAYALARFGKTLHGNLNAAAMVNEIEEFERTIDPLPGAPRAA